MFSQMLLLHLNRRLWAKSGSSAVCVFVLHRPDFTFATDSFGFWTSLCCLRVRGEGLTRAPPSASCCVSSRPTDRRVDRRTENHCGGKNAKLCLWLTVWSFKRFRLRGKWFPTGTGQPDYYGESWNMNMIIFHFCYQGINRPLSVLLIYVNEHSRYSCSLIMSCVSCPGCCWKSHSFLFNNMRSSTLPKDTNFLTLLSLLTPT